MVNETPVRVYFPGLNGLRFFAALAVVITHVELLKGQMGLPNAWTHPVLFNLGGLGVYFFFVLSGFLITYLLLSEKQHTGSVHIWNFYVRRMLRIWPLYYFIVILGFFVFPHFPILKLAWHEQYFEQGFWLKFWLNVLMLPNLALALFPAIPHIGQIWSIGVEEQFYLLWPWLVKKGRVFLRSIFVLFLMIVVIKSAVLAVSIYYPGNRLIIVLKSFVAMSKIECMAIGAAGAYFLFKKDQRVLSVVYNTYIQVLAFIGIPLLIYFTPSSLQDGIHMVYSILFLVIILNVASNPESLLKLENRALNMLGSISYGIYMYHMFVVVLVIRLVHNYFGDASAGTRNWLYYTFVILITIGLSWVSFHFLEKPISNMRKRYSSIESGPETKQAS
jgi:peptidoglycan/LPS O-acetylase OafA/YrhL